MDETGTTTAMDRAYGRAPGGVRVDGPGPHGHRRATTLTAAVRLGGVPGSAGLTFDGATGTARFEADVGHCPVPSLRPGDVAVMGGPACHKTAEVRRPIGAAGAEAWDLPPYSPDLDPIGAPCGGLKEALREAKARTAEALSDAMGEALRSVMPADIRGWCAQSGY